MIAQGNRLEVTQVLFLCVSIIVLSLFIRNLLFPQGNM